MHGMFKIIFSPFQGMKGALYYLRLCLANFRDNRYKFDTLVLLPTIQKVKLVLKWVANIKNSKINSRERKSTRYLSGRTIKDA